MKFRGWYAPGLEQRHPARFVRLMTNITVSLAAKLRIANEHMNILPTQKTHSKTHSKTNHL